MQRVLALLAVVVLAAWAATALLGDDRRPSALVPGEGTEDPFAWDPDREEEFTERAAAGHSHVLYAKSPDGVVASAARVARYRDLIETIAGEAGHDADTMEAIVFLESAGRPDARASDDPGSATGLTQILGETGRGLLAMRVDEGASRRLTRDIGRAERNGRRELADRLRARRRVVDERYDPEKALRGTARYLTFAEEQLGRDDLAVVSYHMGVGNLQAVLGAYGGDEDTPYAELYFDSSPLRHAEAWARLAELGDDSSTYLWRVAAAREIMRLSREDPAELARRAELQTAKNSAEELLHPESETETFADPEAIDEALEDGTIVPLPSAELAAEGVVIDGRMGELATRLDRKRTLYRALRPEALALLTHLSRGTMAISGETGLRLTSTVRDRAYQRLLVNRNPEATQAYSLHTTGWALDIERRYTSRAQARGFQFMLDRLQSLDLIAWVREPAAIHLTVGPDAEALLGLLEEDEG